MNGAPDFFKETKTVYSWYVWTNMKTKWDYAWRRTCWDDYEPEEQAHEEIKHPMAKIFFDTEGKLKQLVKEVRTYEAI